MLGLTRAALTGANVAFGRFQADHPNELWTGDALHGPVIAGRKAVLFAVHRRLQPARHRAPLELYRGHPGRRGGAAPWDIGEGPAFHGLFGQRLELCVPAIAPGIGGAWGEARPQ